MQQTLDPTLEVVAQAKGNFERINARLLHLLSFVPDDKLTWTPSATAKSPLRVAAHSALTSRIFAKLITGKMPEAMPAPEELFATLNADELNYPTRESVIALTNETAAELCQALDTVNTENIESSPNSPFGPVPMRFWLTVCHDHMAGHVGQLEFLQTIWGDLDNHR